MVFFVLLVTKFTKTEKALNTNLRRRILLELNGKCENTNRYSVAPLSVFHKSNTSSVPRGIVDSYSAPPWVTWKAVTVVKNIP